MTKNKALVVGSVAFDLVFDVHNTFKDEVIVKDGQLQDVSMMLTAKNKQIYFGGTAGNISYGLGIQGENPYLFSVVGDDFNEKYKSHLQNNNVNIKTVEKEDEYTASFYAISDSKLEQIGIFQPNTHGDYMHKIKLSDTLTQEDLDSIAVAIFSPGTGESTENHMIEFRDRVGSDPIVIFDPSQVLSIFFDKERLEKCLKLSNIFIGNETEIKQLQNIMGMNITNILELGIDYIIETKGENGSLIHSAKSLYEIQPVHVDNFVEQTGAGDAYRAGLIKGLLSGFDIQKSCEIASEVAAKSVQSKGGQEYKL